MASPATYSHPRPNPSFNISQFDHQINANVKCRFSTQSGGDVSIDHRVWYFHLLECRVWCALARADMWQTIESRHVESTRSCNTMNGLHDLAQSITK